ncbi:AraC family transcriptional regulator [Paenibacillus hodogayensis]|uniref:AraC family transcriptional regulator n=1 Tax=Paenibacillus hodogayensis TaxID=279208 RepID=A0ABV5W0H4_9BACL
MSSFIPISSDVNLDFMLGSLTIRIVRLIHVLPDPDWYTPEHFHTDYEIHIIPSGRGYIRIDDAELLVQAGQFFITGPFVKHSQRSDPDDPMAEYCIHCEIIESANRPEEASANPLRSILSAFLPLVFQDTRSIVQDFESIMAEDSMQPVGYVHKIQSLLIGILVHLVRIVTEHRPLPGPDAGRGCMTSNEQRVDRVLNYIHTQYRQTIRASDASRILFLSERQMNRILKQALGLTFQEYLIQYRVRMACQFMKEGELSIGEIAERTGFSSVSYLYQTFKSRKLDTPGMLRKRLKP